MALEVPSLGRPFSLGMFYDAREENIIPGITLWNKEELAKNISTVSQNNTEFDVLTSDSVSDKFSALNVSAELKICVWAGKVEVGGSGKYMNNKKESKTQARVILKYKRTTKFEHLTMDHLYHKNITYQEVFEKRLATHVVTGILYGAQAFFVFDQKHTNSEKAREIEGKLKGVVAKIGKLKAEGKMNDTEKELVHKFNCTFHGDFALEKNPTTFEEAVEIYTKLPSLLGKDEEKAVPIKVWLHPLKSLEDSVAQLVRDISHRLVLKAEELMQEMSDVVMECNDMMNHPVAGTFPALGNKISKFKQLFEHFRLVLQKNLSKVLSSVRGGNMEEFSLEELLTMKERSPFSVENIRKFLNRRKREMEVVHSALKQLTDFSVVSEESELTREILDPLFENTICFNFSSLDLQDSYLSHLESWLNKETWDFQDRFSDDNEQWFEQSGILKRIKKLVQDFKEMANSSTTKRFLVSSVVCSASPGIALNYYESGELVVSTTVL